LWRGPTERQRVYEYTIKNYRALQYALQNPCHDALENFVSGNYSIEIRGGGENMPSVLFEIVGQIRALHLPERHQNHKRQMAPCTKIPSLSL
jgi:hypothetical protein